MAKAISLDGVPQLKNVVIPEIVELVNPVPHFVVGAEVFLVRSRAVKRGKELGVSVANAHGPVSVFTVGDDSFLTREEAEKKVITIMRKYRDEVREVARIFGVENASAAERNVALKWFLETYELSEIRDVFGYEHFVKSPEIPEVFRQGGLHVDFLVSSLASRIFFSVFPQLFRRYHLRITPYEGATVDVWSWVQGLNLDAEFGVPAKYQHSYVLRDAWFDEKKAFSHKMSLVHRLVDLRFLELLFIEGQRRGIGFSGNDENFLNLKDLVSSVDLGLIAAEVQDLYAVVNQAEMGAELELAVKNGEVVYAVNGGSRLGACFKRF